MSDDKKGTQQWDGAKRARSAEHRQGPCDNCEGREDYNGCPKEISFCPKVKKVKA